MKPAFRKYVNPGNRFNEFLTIVLSPMDASIRNKKIQKLNFRVVLNLNNRFIASAPVDRPIKIFWKRKLELGTSLNENVNGKNIVNMLLGEK